MNYGAVLRRAFEITRRYPMLWLFGILVALTAGGTSSTSSYQVSDMDFQGGNWPNWLWGEDAFRQLGEWFSRIDPGRFIGVLIAVCCFAILLALIAVIVQYVARVALIRSVDQIEATGVAPTWQQGFRLGWSNRAFRLWLLELLIGIAFFLVALFLMALAASPLLLLLTRNDAARVIGVMLSVFIGLPALLLLFAASIVVSVLGQFWAREIALADRGIGEAFTRGYALARARLKDVGLFWLLMAGIDIAVSLLLIPAMILLFLIGLVAGGALGYAVYSIGNSIVAALAVGLPIFLLLVGIPATFVSGLFETFKSSAWTLAYREVAPAATR